MKRMLCTMVWLGICAALVGCTTSAIEGPETVSHHVDPSSSVSDPASSEDPSPLGKALFRLPRKRSSFRFTTERTRNSAMGKRIGWSASRTTANGRCSNISRIRRGTTSGSSRPRTPRASTASTRSIIMGRKHSRKATTVMGIRLMGRRTMWSLILGRFEGERSRLFYK